MSAGLLLYSYVLNAVESFFFLFVFQLNPPVNFYVTEVGQSETFSSSYYSPSLLETLRGCDARTPVTSQSPADLQFPSRPSVCPRSAAISLFIHTFNPPEQQGVELHL